MNVMKNIPLPARLLLACVMTVALLSGCSQKKQVVVKAPPPPAAVPPAEPQPTPAEPQAQTQESQPATQGTPPPETQPADEKPADAAKAKTPKPRPTPKKTTETARNTPPKVVKPNGAETAPAGGEISPALSHDEMVHSQANTEQLLQSTEATLNGIKRQLSSEEEAIRTQIRDFMNQSRQATKANDLTRAYNLATKARLLADDLAKR